MLGKEGCSAAERLFTSRKAAISSGCCNRPLIGARTKQRLNASMTITAAPSTRAPEDTLIDALRGCRHQEALLDLRDHLLQNPSNPPLFDWICQLLVARRISRGLAARLLSQLHSAVLER